MSAARAIGDGRGPGRRCAGASPASRRRCAAPASRSATPRRTTRRALLASPARRPARAAARRAEGAVLLAAIPISRASTNCSTRSGADAAPSRRRGSRRSGCLPAKSPRIRSRRPAARERRASLPETADAPPMTTLRRDGRGRKRGASAHEALCRARTSRKLDERQETRARRSRSPNGSPAHARAARPAASARARSGRRLDLRAHDPPQRRATAASRST